MTDFRRLGNHLMLEDHFAISECGNLCWSDGGDSLVWEVGTKTNTRESSAGVPSSHILTGPTLESQVLVLATKYIS